MNYTTVQKPPYTSVKKPFHKRDEASKRICSGKFPSRANSSNSRASSMHKENVGMSAN